MRRAFAPQRHRSLHDPTGVPDRASTGGWINNAVIFRNGVGCENRVGSLNRSPNGKRLVGGDGFEPPTLSV